MDFIKDLTIDNLRNAAEDVFNQAKPKSEVEARVYEVLSHKNWGSSSTVMNEIARDTYDFDKFPVITRIMWESMENQRPAAWRVVFKGLTLVDFLVRNGCERCVDDARNHSHLLRKLLQFNYYEGTVDRGLGVREKSKQLMDMLSDDERIREERVKAKQLREKFGGSLGGVSSNNSGGIGGGGSSQYGGYGNDSSWDSRNSGYGESGIGGRNSNNETSYRADSGGGFSGRYSDDSATRTAATSTNAPTFATIPDEATRKKVIKKKKKKPTADEFETPTAPEVDLFSFDAPAPTVSAPSVPPAVQFDAFGTSAPPEPKQNQFDAFGTMLPSSQHQNQLDDFGDFKAAPTSVMGTQQAMTPGSVGFDAFADQPSNVPMNQMNTAFVQMSMGAGMASNAINANGTTLQQPIGVPSFAPGVVDDDFGDFKDANPNKIAPPTNDPMSRLIQLDGLSKNQNKKPTTPMSAASNQVAFGQNPVHFTANPGFQGNLPTNVPFSTSGAVAGGADVIGMMSPQVMMSPQHAQISQRSNMVMQSSAGAAAGFGGMQMGGLQPQMGTMGHQQASNPMFLGPGMIPTGMGVPAVHQSGMMMSPQMLQQQHGVNPQMMQQQQGMNPQMMQQQQGINPQMLQGGMGMQAGMMSGSNTSGGQMGGQPMQGWR